MLRLKVAYSFHRVTRSHSKLAPVEIVAPAKRRIDAEHEYVEYDVVAIEMLDKTPSYIAVVVTLLESCRTNKDGCPAVLHSFMI